MKLVHAVVYTHCGRRSPVRSGQPAASSLAKLNGPLPIYCTDEVEEVIRQAFPYVFDPVNDELPPGMIPRLAITRIDEHAPFDVLGERFTPIPLQHGRFNVFGFRVGNVAYCTDVSGIPDRSWPLLEGLDVFVIDALRPGKPHPAHFSLEQAVAAIERVKPRQAYFTHMAHMMEYDELMRTLPKGIEPAYDGLSFRF